MTVDLAADELIGTLDCEHEGCTAEGKRRPNMKRVLCDEHVRTEMRRRAFKGNGGLVQQAKQLEALAHQLEPGRVKAEPAVRELQAAQRDWNAAVQALPQK